MYVGPEDDQFYQKYWSQYQDDQENDPSWLDHFRQPNDQIMNHEQTTSECPLDEEEDTD